MFERHGGQVITVYARAHTHTHTCAITQLPSETLDQIRSPQVAVLVHVWPWQGRGAVARPSQLAPQRLGSTFV